MGGVFVFEWVGCEWVGVYVSGLVGAMKWKIVLRPLKMPFVVCNIELYCYHWLRIAKAANRVFCGPCYLFAGKTNANNTSVASAMTGQGNIGAIRQPQQDHSSFVKNAGSGSGVETVRQSSVSSEISEAEVQDSQGLSVGDLDIDRELQDIERVLEYARSATVQSPEPQTSHE
ncbi:hypothetical protein DPMN_009124 [Dreissena polymorpha]|uniref:Uncharacterized protein n=1 Tax=Dreissena polymorpha TaxID=45954 RepID=A0A9D4RXY2_DREPO|nr:hypothetical protein DPMN_009124 [Dreissena polymorpha]